MKSQDEWAAEQARYLAAYDEIRAELLRIPGVVEVGVGVKETGDSLSDEMAFRVYVREKLPLDALPPEHIIPPFIRSFRTDVIIQRDERRLIGFGDEDDWKNYSPKVGGIRIGNDKHQATGTLGCFARRNSDNKVVLLSNHHVLFDGYDKGQGLGAKVGQPKHEESCCCTCNEIGVVVDGDLPAPAGLDCAIATLNADVAFIPKIRKIKKGNDVELTGIIAGSAAAQSNEEVWKVGARTGLTRGRVSQVAPRIEVTPIAPFPRFANEGDSGSVIVRLGGEVIGLLRAIDSGTGTRGFGSPIGAVLARLKITIIPTDETQEYDVAELDDEMRDLASRVAAESPFAAIARRLDTSEAGRELLVLAAAHRREILDLVNQRRPVTVAWHRAQGPTWLAALARSAKEPAYRLPDELAGVGRAEALRLIVAALTAHGGDTLRADLAANADLGPLLARCDTVDELVRMWEERALAAQASDPA